MSSFSDMNAYMSSAREAQQHLESYKNDIVASKVGDIRERYEAAISKIGALGQATTGASSAFHLGRKVYKKTKEKYGKDPEKDNKRSNKKEGEGEGEGEGVGEDRPLPEGAVEYKNPAFDPSSVNETHDLSKEPTKTEPEKTEGNEPDSEESTQGGKHVTEEDIPEGAGGGEDVSGLGRSGGLSKEDAQKFTQSGDTDVVSDVSNNASGVLDDAANAGKRVISSTLDGAGDAAKAGLNSFKEAGENMLKNGAAKIAEKVGFDIGGAALDAIPVIGEVAGVAQIFHGLFKEHKIRAKEAKAESSASSAIRSMGSVAVGGIDTSAQAGNQTVAGIV